ncbi:MAG: c-type cytochrome [Caldimonas sp.]
MARARAAAAVASALLCVASAASAASAAPFEDTMAQRVLACTGCHGPEGRAAPDGYYPRIAGKPAGYLTNQLLNFRDGRRPYALMSNLLAPLSDAYLAEIASHFAALELPYPAPAASDMPEAERARVARLVTEGDARRGLPACNACHGAAMTGTAPFVPGLIGLPRDYLNAQLGAWRAGKRSAQAPDCMAQVAQALAPDEIAQISAWLASQPLPADTKPAVGFSAPPPIACGGVPVGTVKATR